MEEIINGINDYLYSKNKMNHPVFVLHKEIESPPSITKALKVHKYTLWLTWGERKTKEVIAQATGIMMEEVLMKEVRAEFSKKLVEYLRSNRFKEIEEEVSNGDYNE